MRRGSRSRRGAPPRSNVEETILDIARISDEAATVAACTRALTEGFTVGARVASLLDQRERQRHRELLLRLCSSSNRGIESVLEYLFEKNVLRPHGLPLPARQTRKGRRRVDAEYDAYGWIVELDGGRYHRDKHHDYHRDNEHLLMHSERTLRFGWAQSTMGACVSALQLSQALQQGGWKPNGLRKCGHAACPL